jgi:GPH family glycoside/pentoside/hexuronide:cation symporter
VAAIFVAAIPALPLWSRLARAWDKRLAYITGVAFWAVVQIILTIAVGPATSLAVLLVLCVLAGIGVGAAHVLPWSILPDAVEWDEWQTGERHEGMFYSLVTLAQKAASAASIPLVLLVLDAAGYQAGATDQPPAVVRAIRIVAGPVPAALLGLGIVSALLYPLTRERYARITQELEERRRAAAGNSEGKV